MTEVHPSSPISLFGLPITIISTPIPIPYAIAPPIPYASSISKNQPSYKLYNADPESTPTEAEDSYVEEYSEASEQGKFFLDKHLKLNAGNVLSEISKRGVSQSLGEFLEVFPIYTERPTTPLELVHNIAIKIMDSMHVPFSTVFSALISVVEFFAKRTERGQPITFFESRNGVITLSKICQFNLWQVLLFKFFAICDLHFPIFYVGDVSGQYLTMYSALEYKLLSAWLDDTPEQKRLYDAIADDSLPVRIVDPHAEEQFEVQYMRMVMMVAGVLERTQQASITRTYEGAIDGTIEGTRDDSRCRTHEGAIVAFQDTSGYRS